MKTFRQLNTRTGVFQVKSLNVPHCDFCKNLASHEVLQDSNRAEFPNGKAFMCDFCYANFCKGHKVNVYVSEDMSPLPSPMGFENKRSAKGLNIASRKVHEVSLKERHDVQGFLDSAE